MGSCAKLWALPADLFQRWIDLPSPPPPAGVSAELWRRVLSREQFDADIDEMLLEHAEGVAWMDCKRAFWQDDADNFLSRFLAGENFQPLPSAEAAAALGRPVEPLARPSFGDGRVLFREVLTPEERDLRERMQALLGLVRRPQIPWWLDRLYGGGFRVGLLSPKELAVIMDGLARSDVLELGRAWHRATSGDGCLDGLAGFLAEAHASSCWILGVEGQS